ncbi:hypothetical protein GGF42_005743 [Coemansia sp. RSA 2424]|nr:hypothetical protein GGF42_005743 [Coemansia sp. RSA 2424]
MSPIGKPLHTVESAEEFVTVVCDVMRCHDAIVQHCGVLHRDISENNVLAVRRNGIARGLLIDFDCAIDTSGGTSTSKRPEMTGTLPLMSINNLSNSDVQRTALDDWESMLCLVCWMATFGISEAPTRNCDDLEGYPIASWQTGTRASIVNAKHRHFGSKYELKRSITDSGQDSGQGASKQHTYL